MMTMGRFDDVKVVVALIGIDEGICDQANSFKEIIRI
jgi:hypothetical protein